MHAEPRYLDTMQTATLTFEVSKITILHDQHGPDYVLLNTSYPSPMPKCVEQKLCIKFETEAGTAEEYLKRNFPQIPEGFVVDIIYF
jgi:hypothetical protein